MAPMQVSVHPLEADQVPVLRNLCQFYAYDFAELAGWDVPASGRFDDDIVEGCEPGGARHAFLLRVDGALAGFAIVDSCSCLDGDPAVFDMAEFFVARRYRRRGVGAAAAAAVLARFPGRWEIRQTTSNPGATAFWREVARRVATAGFDEVVVDSPAWRGPVQRFSVGPSATPPAVLTPSR